MSNMNHSIKIVGLLVCMFIAGRAVIAQASPPAAVAVEPAMLSARMADFTLPTLQGGEVSLAGLAGKNVIIVFPRVQYRPGQWCSICNYHYAELAALDARDQIRKKFNAEILFVVPFGREISRQWIDATPDELVKVQSMKNPPNPDGWTEETKRRVAHARRLFPLDLSIEKGKMTLPFPILLDAERKLTVKLGLFQTEWGGTQAEQLIPSVLILDKNSVVQFKYIAQNVTWDRPTTEYLLHVLAVINGGVI
ncbi:MAG: redoxin domain-containing protein [Vicinamibacteria bacterium]|nr:redoxin domain-containing protein [Vicinamibacteria bacterium]